MFFRVTDFACAFASSTLLLWQNAGGETVGRWEVDRDGGPVSLAPKNAPNNLPLSLLQPCLRSQILGKLRRVRDFDFEPPSPHRFPSQNRPSVGHVFRSFKLASATPIWRSGAGTRYEKCRPLPGSHSYLNPDLVTEEA